MKDDAKEREVFVFPPDESGTLFIDVGEQGFELTRAEAEALCEQLTRTLEESEEAKND